MKVENTLFVSDLLLLKDSPKEPPVGTAWPRPKFQTEPLVVTSWAPEKALLCGLVCEFLLRTELTKGS